MNQRSQANPDELRSRQAYVRPALREFGPVGKLTQAGTAMQAEMGQDMSPAHMA